ncbi:MAG: sulfur carrier protein ThiS adenylyltransferase ThiF, partial [Proteobacteria bacterium]|nr:sulfur carrier protein ThiS adenylyltransferase ThiF [Pseudomonadota bacterium]
MTDFKLGIKRYLSDEKLEKIENTVVGIAGAGGLGSNCAHALVRLGFRHFILVDHDTIEPSNLNRQFYFSDQLGILKVEALMDNLYRINSELEITAKALYLDGENVSECFSSCTVVVEAFDTIDAKKMILENLSGSGKRIISGSGLGFEGD